MAAVLGALLFIVLSSIDSQATPIKPDVQKMLQQSQRSRQPFIPARAGWSDSAVSSAAVNPALQSIAQDHLRREFQETLAAIATPDPWLVVALAAVIILMRKLRSMEAERKPPTVVGVIEPEAPSVRLAA